MDEEDIFENEDEQDHMRRFIEHYEVLPVLWNSSLESYKNKNKRKTAMLQLLLTYQKVKPGATVKELSKKINSLKSNYNKEVKKIIASKRKTGSSPESVYVPSSWTFQALQFLGGSQLPVNYVSF